MIMLFKAASHYSLRSTHSLTHSLVHAYLLTHSLTYLLAHAYLLIHRLTITTHSLPHYYNYYFPHLAKYTSQTTTAQRAVQL